MEFFPIGSPFSCVFLSPSLFLTFGRCKMIVCVHSNEMLWLLLHSRAVQVSCRQYSVLLRASTRIRKEKHIIYSYILRAYVRLGCNFERHHRQTGASLYPNSSVVLHSLPTTQSTCCCMYSFCCAKLSQRCHCSFV